MSVNPVSGWQPNRSSGLYETAICTINMWLSVTKISYNNNNNNNDFLCANILEDQARWHDKTKTLSNLVIVNDARVVNGWMKALGSYIHAQYKLYNIKIQYLFQSFKLVYQIFIQIQ